jgi:hypothetical protein
MAATKYTYSITNDFPNDLVASNKLSIEIEASSIVGTLERIDTVGDDCDIWFADALSGGDQTTLNGLVAAHSGSEYTSVKDGYLYSEAESSTTGTAWLQKAYYAVGNVAAGDYWVEWYCEVKTTDNTNPMCLRVRQDDTTTLGETSFVPDSSGNNGWVSQSGFAKVTLSNGDYVFDMDYCSLGTGKTEVSIRRARIRLIKVD